MKNDICRICHYPSNNLKKYCNCKGTSGYYHKECLENWINFDNRFNCEICNKKYDIVIKSNIKYSNFIIIFLKKFFIILTIYLILFYLIYLKNINFKNYFIKIYFLLIFSLFLFNIFNKCLFIVNNNRKLYLKF